MQKCCHPIRFQDFQALISQNYWSCKVDFLHAGKYLLKLQLNEVILGGHGQACPGTPKEAIKT